MPTTPLRIVIVDDNLHYRNTISSYLQKKNNFQVVAEVGDGLAAIQAVEKHRPDVVLMDVSMPVMDGIDATWVIKSKFPEIRVIVLTIHAGLRAEALAAGKSHEDAVKAAESLITRAYLYGSLSTLKYLALGGRVSTIAASMANLLNIRPILTMQNNKLELLEKVRTHKVAMARLVELLVGSVGERPIERAAILHVNNLADAKHLEAELRKKLTLPADLLLVDFGPGLSVHAGAGMVGAVLVAIGLVTSTWSMQ